jgi:hypothetical protein
MSINRIYDYIEGHQNEIIDKIKEFYINHVLDSERIELRINNTNDIKIEVKSNTINDSTRNANEQGYLILACGGENITAWDLLPKVGQLLDKEDIDICSDEISAKTGKNIKLITVGDMQKHIEETRPSWIKQWLDEYFYLDPLGSLENYVQYIYEKLLSDLDGNEE